ncbi:hypothetical protein JAAARDRAFT_33515 [Jaapia argillacea MUCL 33604]|uniref:TERF2-interacting telomeric protein 1 Myb domain-containing protein n=1 Tax=Jaapia argillacea MUCL 33604 TaxID=933084 RepID=A0A067Q8X3_9AGAM|nr:hypothetical protein JAAARDRAFT_33515 [Jaapia argillacea MUCL 33604]
MARTVHRSPSPRISVQPEKDPSTLFKHPEGDPVLFYLNRLTEGQVHALKAKIRSHGGNLAKKREEADVIICDDNTYDHLTMIFAGDRRIRVELLGFVQRCINQSEYRHEPTAKMGMGGPIPRKDGQRKRVEFTNDDDYRLCKYIASRIPCPEAGGRKGNNIYKTLVAQGKARKKMAWTRRHTWQSWRERYIKNSERMDALIDECVKDYPPLKDGSGQYHRDRTLGRGGRGQLGDEDAGSDPEGRREDESELEEEREVHKSPAETSKKRQSRGSGEEGGRQSIQHLSARKRARREEEEEDVEDVEESRAARGPQRNETKGKGRMVDREDGSSSPPVEFHDSGENDMDNAHNFARNASPPEPGPSGRQRSSSQENEPDAERSNALHDSSPLREEPQRTPQPQPPLRSVRPVLLNEASQAAPPSSQATLVATQGMTGQSRRSAEKDLSPPNFPHTSAPRRTNERRSGAAGGSSQPRPAPDAPNPSSRSTNRAPAAAPISDDHESRGPPVASTVVVPQQVTRPAPRRRIPTKALTRPPAPTDGPARRTRSQSVQPRGTDIPPTTKTRGRNPVVGYAGAQRGGGQLRSPSIEPQQNLQARSRRGGKGKERAVSHIDEEHDDQPQGAEEHLDASERRGAEYDEASLLRRIQEEPDSRQSVGETQEEDEVAMGLITHTSVGASSARDIDLGPDDVDPSVRDDLHAIAGEFSSDPIDSTDDEKVTETSQNSSRKRAHSGPGQPEFASMADYANDVHNHLKPSHRPNIAVSRRSRAGERSVLSDSNTTANRPRNSVVTPSRRPKQSTSRRSGDDMSASSSLGTTTDDNQYTPPVGTKASDVRGVTAYSPYQPPVGTKARLSRSGGR